MSKTTIITILKGNCKNEEVKQEIEYQCDIMRDLCIRFTRNDILAMCKCKSELQVENYAHSLKFA